jgi:formylglycine-generating enzyme required for sulfatase activity
VLVKLTLFKRSTLGGALGLIVLLLAFAYRWGAWPGGSGGSGEGVVRELYEPHPASVSSVGIDTGPALPDLSLGPPIASVATDPDADAEDDDDTDDTPSPAALAADLRADLDDALARGKSAQEAGRLVFPAEDNAVSWFDKALELDAKNRAARRGRRIALRDATEFANAAIDSGDLKTANVWIAAIDEVRDAEAHQKALHERLDNLPRVAAFLREAAQRIAAEQYFEPVGASALDSYRAALAIDARNGAAKQGLAEIEETVLTRALAAASGDQFADADRLLELAATISPGTQAQLETRSRIVQLRADRGRVLLDRVVTALDAREIDRASEFLLRAEAFGVDGAEVAALRAKLANARIYDHNNPGEVFADAFVDRQGTGPKLVVVPIGRFTMGSAESERGRSESEGPVHTVQMSRPFALGLTEITVAQYRRFVRDSDYKTDAERDGSSGVYDEGNGRITTGTGITWRQNYAGEDAPDNLPVVHISWNDANAYAAWLAERTGKRYRLPSEAEFEYVLRAGTTTRYWWGAGNLTTVRGNFTGSQDRSRSRRTWTRAFPRYDDGYWGPAPVGTFPTNPFGVHDIDGNVSEWVDDCWHDSYLRAPEDGSAWVNRGCARRVVRGGSWGSAPEQVRSAFRQSSNASTRGGRIGFRVAREL